MTTSRWPRVAVMGGSIGGLTAGLLLRDLGCQVDIYERSSEALQDRGAGIILLPHTYRYFDEYSPLDTREVSIAPYWWTFVDRRGQVLSKEPLGSLISSWNTIYRGLLSDFGEDRYHLRKEVTGFSQTEKKVRVRFADGEEVAADLLVAADGINSLARSILNPPVSPAYAGYVAWRGTIPESDLSPAAAEETTNAMVYCLMPSGHSLAYAIPSQTGSLVPGERLMNLVWYYNCPEGAPLDDLLTDTEGIRRPWSVPPGFVRTETLSRVRREAEETMAPVVREVVDGAEDLFIQVIFDVASPRMARGRVCVIGDAAFAVRPHAAAGTAKACDDAFALRDSLAEKQGNVTAALRHWEPGRLEVGRNLIARSRWIGETYQVRCDAIPGDPRLQYGLYGPGN
ncbi:MAG: FAD-dependent monooxygenase [bacterium]|nr:FAD-dependent monooxygenase [Acidimicrobiia bacterium]MCY4650937.1 FAD-dependent monooxygenase [bacterium]